MIEINRKQIMETFMRILDHISDKDYQKRVWIRGEGPEVDDFDETVCHFFQEGDGIIEDCQEFGITREQNQLLKKFRDEFEKFSDNNDFPEKFIDTPEWEKIRETSKKLLKSFSHKEACK